MVAVSDLVYKKLPDNGLGDLIRSLYQCDLQHGAWVAGGCVRKSWFDLAWKDQDVDFFFPNMDSFRSFSKSLEEKFDTNSFAVTVDLVNQISSSLKNLLVKRKPHLDLFSTDNADTWTNSGENPWKVQAIRKEFPRSLTDLFDGFDFTVCQFATDGDVMVATKAALYDCQNGVFSMANGKNDHLSVSRIAKYSAYGFAPSDSIMKQILESFMKDEPMGGWDGY